MTGIEDYILVRRVQIGDSAAFEVLVNKYYQNIYVFCVRRCNGDTGLAEDLTQETFLRLFEHIRDYRPSGKFINFLLTIAVNLCNNHYRKNIPAHVELEESKHEQTCDTADVAEEILRRERIRTVAEAVSRLPDYQKEAVILRFYHDRKLREIAAITGVSLPTAKSRLRQGLARLRKYLEEVEPPDGRQEGKKSNGKEGASLCSCDLYSGRDIPLFDSMRCCGLEEIFRTFIEVRIQI